SASNALLHPFGRTWTGVASVPTLRADPAPGVWRRPRAADMRPVRSDPPFTGHGLAQVAQAAGSTGHQSLTSGKQLRLTLQFGQKAAAPHQACAAHDSRRLVASFTPQTVRRNRTNRPLTPAFAVAPPQRLKPSQTPIEQVSRKRSRQPTPL